MAHRPKKKAATIQQPMTQEVMVASPDAVRSWKMLKDGINEIFSANRGGLDLREFSRIAYNMMEQGYGNSMYSGLFNITRRHLDEIATTFKSVQGENLLEELQKQWSKYFESVSLIGTLLECMDKNFSVLRLEFYLWQTHIMLSAEIRRRWLPAILDLVDRERCGLVINRELMGSNLSMLTHLERDFYTDYFEKHFVNSGENFYKRESQHYLQTSTCAEYLSNAQRRLDEEKERACRYLHPLSPLKKKMINALEGILIGNHTRRLVGMESGLASMLIDWKYSDLNCMYELFIRVPGGLSIMRDAMINYLQKTGAQLVMDPKWLNHPVDFVQQLLGEKDKWHFVIRVSFENDETFHDAMKSSFEYFINLNSRVPEFICVFLDEKLRKGFKDVNEEAETLLDKVVALFRYLGDKDVFETYYRKHLAMRLLSGRAVSHDSAERSMIAKLKKECGSEFTSKLECMLTDLNTSKKTHRKFNAIMHDQISSVQAGESEPNLVVKVLTTGIWPIQSSSRCTLPSEILPMCEKFKSYYLSIDKRRRLTWQTNMGTADLNATFGNGQKHHELNVSTYQMCILVLFNEADTLSYSQIRQATDMAPEDLKRNLQSLACVPLKNVLRKEPIGKNITEDDVFHFNDTFSSKSMRVKIYTIAAPKMESESEHQERQKVVQKADRKPQIEAAIVRIMKSRRVLDHSALITEVTQQVRDKFLPDPSTIKKQIESLMQREFLERDPSDSKLYRYLA